MLTYLFQTIICSAILYGYYYCLLRNSRFHVYNRFYLLASSILSVLIPLLNIPTNILWDGNDDVISKTIYFYREIMLPEVTIINQPSTLPVSTTQVAIIFIGIISIFLIAKIIISVLLLVQEKKRSVTKKTEGITLIETTLKGSPFSFFSWIFWNKTIDIHSHEGRQILLHEYFHIRQKHSVDLLFIETLAAIFWFNPFLHLFKKDLKTTHEFLADRHVSNLTGPLDYAEVLLLQTIAFKKRQLINPFFNNQLKRRIAMLTSPSKTTFKNLRKILGLLCVGIVFTLCAFNYKIDFTKGKAIATNGFNAIAVKQDMLHQYEPDDKPSIHEKVNKSTAQKKQSVSIPKTGNDNTQKNIQVQTYTQEVSAKQIEDVIPAGVITSSSIDINEPVFTKVEHDAEYPGGPAAWRRYLEMNVKSDVAADNGAKEGIYKAVIKFVVDKDGSVNNLTIVKNPGYGIGEEALRVIAQSGNWIPAMQNGIIVKAYRIQPITLQVIDVKEDAKKE